MQTGIVSLGQWRNRHDSPFTHPPGVLKKLHALFSPVCKGTFGSVVEKADQNENCWSQDLWLRSGQTLFWRFSTSIRLFHKQFYHTRDETVRGWWIFTTLCLSANHRVAYKKLICMFVEQFSPPWWWKCSRVVKSPDSVGWYNSLWNGLLGNWFHHPLALDGEFFFQKAVSSAPRVVLFPSHTAWGIFITQCLSANHGVAHKKWVKLICMFSPS